MRCWESYIVFMRWPVPHYHNVVAAVALVAVSLGAGGVGLAPRAALAQDQLRPEAGPEAAPEAAPDLAPEANREAPDSAAPDDAEPGDTESRAPDADALSEPASTAEPTADALRRQREDLDLLFAELAQPGGKTWERAETDILRIWSRSGSASMDLLMKRGEAALDADDAPTAIGHLTALTDHAPEFAGGYYLRGVAYYLSGQFGPAIADMAQTLALEPRHFAALTQIGAMYEELGDNDRALIAYRASLKINPHQEDAADAVTRLEQLTKGTDA